MSIKDISIRQDQKEQIEKYLYFFPEDLNKFCHDNYRDDEIKYQFSDFLNKSHINILIPGMGAGCFEIPLICKIFDLFKGEVINILAIDKSDRFYEIFIKIINIIKHDKKKNIKREEIHKVIREMNWKDQVETQLDGTEYFYIISKGKKQIRFIYKIKNLDFDPEINKDLDINDDFLSNFLKTNYKNFDTNEYENIFKRKYFDLVILSFVLFHINYWRSLIAYLNEYLEDNGKIVISEIAGDNLILGGNLLRWKLENTNSTQLSENKEILFDFFDKFYFNKFSIISDNGEISSSNNSLLLSFMKLGGSLSKSTTIPHPKGRQCHLIPQRQVQLIPQFFQSRAKRIPPF